jgi:hypothetical protein
MERVFCVSACVLTKKKKREEKNSKSLSRCVTSGTNYESRAKNARKRRRNAKSTHTHHHYIIVILASAMMRYVCAMQ